MEKLFTGPQTKANDAPELPLQPNEGDKSLPDQSLYDALDAAAPDAASWKRGYARYYESIDSGNSTEQACWDALDASAPDAKSWKEGWAIMRLALYSTASSSDERASVEGIPNAADANITSDRPGGRGKEYVLSHIEPKDNYVAFATFEDASPLFKVGKHIESVDADVAVMVDKTTLVEYNSEPSVIDPPAYPEIFFYPRSEDKWQDVSSLRILNTETGATFSLGDILPTDCRIVVNTKDSKKRDMVMAHYNPAARCVVLPKKPETAGDLMILMHEVGHAIDHKVNPDLYPGQVVVVGSLFDPTGRNREVVLRRERNAWAVTAQELRPFIARDNKVLNESNVRDFIHKVGLGSYCAVIRTANPDSY